MGEACSARAIASLPSTRKDPTMGVDDAGLSVSSPVTQRRFGPRACQSHDTAAGVWVVSSPSLPSQTSSVLPRLI